MRNVDDVKYRVRDRTVATLASASNRERERERGKFEIARVRIVNGEESRTCFREPKSGNNRLRNRDCDTTVTAHVANDPAFKM